MGISNIKALLLEQRRQRVGASNLTMAVWAVFVGVVAGVGAVIFRCMIGFLHNFFFLGQFQFFYDANIHTPPSIWGIGVIFVPVVGSLFVAYLVQNFAPEAKGHGVPEVLDAIYMKQGRIRPVVALVKSLASALSIGTGGSVGREGPIVQIGAAFGSMLGALSSLPSWQRGVLIAAGAAGGIAATFNTPVGALAFAIELMLTTISAVTIFPVAISTVVATYIGRLFFSSYPSFYVPALTIPHFENPGLGTLTFFVFFGLLVGLASVSFVRGLYWVEDIFDDLFKTYYIRHACGMFLMGILLYVTLRVTGHYYLGGVGYASILDILRDAITNPWLLLFLLVGKWLATCLTLGSGASGGIFSPSLFMGATLGAFFGRMMQILAPHFALDPTVFVIAGMAGMISSSTGAVLTGIIMVSEMTHDTGLVLPIILTVAIAYIVRKAISNESIYTLKLLRRGVNIPEGLQSAVFVTQRAEQIATKSYRFVNYKKLVAFQSRYKHPQYQHIPLIVTAHEKPIAIWGYPDVQSNAPEDSVERYLNHHILSIPGDLVLPKILRLMKEHQVQYVLVTKEETLTTRSDVIGLITDREILKYHVDSSYLFPC